ncbi:30S ribosomal protein S17e [Thermoplasmatales archaeon ex4484_6]|nr:MAG: 30S ribosomal protein S17e [Thermoplasmatales archaeon ex4484_6]RLF68285.1 MAG: 30S ribosomal protein S17e [Thermoplasmata archaeon]
MGNIRPTFIKRSAIEILKRYPDQFTDDFDENKVMLDRIAEIQSKSLRNKVAGYITRYRHILARKI